MDERRNAQMMFAAAKAAYDRFHHLWFEVPGVSRADAVAAAFRADEAMEPLWQHVDHLSSAQVEQMNVWLDNLEKEPEIEKRWFGIREYRENHHVKPDLVEKARRRRERWMTPQP